MSVMQYRNRWAEQHSIQSPVLSVIIPTYNRQAGLLRVLDGYLRQQGVGTHDYEVVLADDGSADDTVPRVTDWTASVEMRVKLTASSENRGPAHARNRAIAIAAGDILLITGDDILPPPDFLSLHLRWHREHPGEREALLGRVAWPADPPPSPFMEWLATGGRAFFFSYPAVAGPVSPDRFYTCNVSLKRMLFERAGVFDETFPYASHEDLEMGLRLAERGGMQLHYEPAILGLHDHLLTCASSLRRVYLMGCSSVLFWTKVRDPAPVPKRICREVLKLLSRVVPARLVASVAPIAPRWTWHGLLAFAYWRGAADASRQRRNPCLSGR